MKTRPTAFHQADTRLTSGPYPHFGGRLVGQKLSGHPVTVAFALALAIGSIGMALIPQTSAAGNDGLKLSHRAQHTAMMQDVRTTAKGDRLVRPIKPEAGCDGVWGGSEPLECLLQAA